MRNFVKLNFILLLLFVASCGYSPMLKNTDLENIKISKIDYTGQGDLIYLLKTNLNIPIKISSNDSYNLKMNVNQVLKSLTKNTAGITTEQELIINISFEIYNNEGKKISAESLSESRVISVTNNVATDDEIKRIEKENIIINLSQKLIFAIKAKIISSQK